MIKHQLEAVGFALSDEDKAEIAKLDGTFAAIVNHDTVDNFVESPFSGQLETCLIAQRST